MITRRQLLRGAGVGLAGLVPGCGGRTDRSRVLRISNWPLYIDERTVPDFQQATGITVQYREDVNDNNEFLAKIAEPLSRGQSIDRDIVVLTDWIVSRVIQRGWVAPLDDALFPNKVNLVEAERHVDFDPGRRFSVPWLSGMVGLAYNPREIGWEITSVNDLFDDRLRGRVTMVTEMRDTLGLVMLGMGLEPEHCTLEDARAAGARIRAARERGQIRAFTGNDYVEGLANGNIALAIAWSGDIQGLHADNPDLRWIAPREGGLTFSDNMLIPITSDRRDLAMTWINWCYDPAHSAQIVSRASYISDVQGAMDVLERIAPDLAHSDLVNPPPALRARLHNFRTLSETEEAAFNRLFLDAIGG